MEAESSCESVYGAPSLTSLVQDLSLRILECIARNAGSDPSHEIVRCV
jgi:hypothetical protein